MAMLIVIAEWNQSTEQPFLKLKRNGTGREWHERTTAIVERVSGMAVECVNWLVFSRGDLSGRFPRHAGKLASQSAKSNQPIFPADATRVFDTSLLRRNVQQSSREQWMQHGRIHMGLNSFF
jgi:hypothetical protein